MIADNGIFWRIIKAVLSDKTKTGDKIISSEKIIDEEKRNASFIKSTDPPTTDQLTTGNLLTDSMTRRPTDTPYYQ